MRLPLPPAPPLELLSTPMSHARRALCLLCEAWDAARAENQDIWQFAVEIDELRALGLGHTELRRLLCRGLLEHAVENTEVGACQRSFRPLKALVFSEQTCFVLTGKGLAEISHHAAQPSSEEPAAREARAPRWEGSERQLWWGNSLVKEFRVPAANQERVLAALQEEGWPTRIDDPLPPEPNLDPKSRLHDTIKALNRHQRCRLLRFSGDGRGWGVCWHPADWE
jgi:hypothetical protein